MDGTTLNITNSYDRVGRLSQVKQGTNTTTFDYDANGRMYSETFNGVSVASGFDAAGRKNSMVMMAGASSNVVTYFHDTANRLRDVTNGAYNVRYAYHPNSLLVLSASFRNNTTTRMITTKSFDSDSMKTAGTHEYLCILFALQTLKRNLAISLLVLIAALSANASIFDSSEPLQIDMKVDTNLFHMFQRGQKVYVPAAIRSGSSSVQNIGLRLKGHGSFQPIDQKPAFTVKPSAFQKDQTFLGMKMFHLNNCIQDPSYMSAMLGSELFRKAGVAAPKIRFARVKLNDRDLGLYVLGEATNKDFLKENFGNNKGNLYEGEGRDVDKKLDQDSENRGQTITWFLFAH